MRVGLALNLSILFVYVTDRWSQECIYRNRPWNCLQIYYHHHNRTGYHITNHIPKYAQQLRTSKFCLSTQGGGHGNRQVIGALAGCVLVSIGKATCGLCCLIMEPFFFELARACGCPHEHRSPLGAKLSGSTPFSQIYLGTLCTVWGLGWRIEWLMPLSILQYLVLGGGREGGLSASQSAAEKKQPHPVYNAGVTEAGLNIIIRTTVCFL